MGYRQRGRSSRGFGRGRGVPHREKAKVKKQKRRSSGVLSWEENPVPTSEEVVNRTLTALHNLGSQRFVVSPFSEHLDLWQTNLKNVLSEFESSPSMTLDDQFMKERSQILSDIQSRLQKTRNKETHSGEAVKSLSEKRLLLERIEQDYAARTKEIERRKTAEIRPLSSNVDAAKGELDRIAQMRTGFFRGVSNKTKAQKQAEATHRLNSAQSELEAAVQQFAVEQERLQDEHEKKRQAIIEKIQVYAKEVEGQDIDDSLEARRAACEALANTVNSLMKRIAAST
jgi:hypothetical protein